MIEIYWCNHRQVGINIDVEKQYDCHTVSDDLSTDLVFLLQYNIVVDANTCLRLVSPLNTHYQQIHDIPWCRHHVAMQSHVLMFLVVVGVWPPVSIARCRCRSSPIPTILSDVDITSFVGVDCCCCLSSMGGTTRVVALPFHFSNRGLARLRSCLSVFTCTFQGPFANQIDRSCCLCCADVNVPLNDDWMVDKATTISAVSFGYYSWD